MAISKLILNGVTQMDVTSDTVAANKLLNGETATKNDGTKVTGNIASKTSSDLTVSGATVTAPAGYYASNASKSVATGSVTSPTSISGTSATVSTGTNTLTLTKSVSVTPRVTTAGYVSAGTAGNSSVSLTASVATKAAATITPSTSAQAIASGTYLTGAQTISGDANLVASNIKAGTSIFGASGSFTADADAVASDILIGKTAYVNGVKITGEYPEVPIFTATYVFDGSNYTRESVTCNKSFSEVLSMYSTSPYTENAIIKEIYAPDDITILAGSMLGYNNEIKCVVVASGATYYEIHYYSNGNIEVTGS